ncbi:MAG: hypothetical protein ACI31R_04465 [Bacilli bacterium]
MGVKSVVVTADKVKRRKLLLKNAKIFLLALFMFSIMLFVVLGLVYNGGRFTVTLDPNLSLKSGLIIYEDKKEKRSERKLYAEEVDFMDNISIKWLPENINNEKDGAHNGENYIAYTFYAENTGDEVINYWYEIDIDDVVKNVDEAIRVMIYLNGEKEVYAKVNADTNKNEEGTKAFYSKDIAVLEPRKNMSPGKVDKFTIVIWLEGDDPDCLNNLIGGEIKMHMDITEEHIEQENK